MKFKLKTIKIIYTFRTNNKFEFMSLKVEETKL